MDSLTGQDATYGSDAHAEYANARMKTMEEKTGLKWNFDPAYSGDRFRSFPEAFELLVYENGRYAVFQNYKTLIVEGTAHSFDDALDIAMIAYRKAAT